LVEEENRTFREELLNWINRWKEVNVKKNQYKREKKSMIGTNQHLLEQVEKQKLVIVKLKAKLAEARRVVNLQNRTWWLFSFFKVHGLLLCQTGNKIFVMHACKIADFTGTHLNYGLFRYIYFNWFLIRCFVCLNTGGYVIVLLHSFMTFLICWLEDVDVHWRLEFQQRPRICQFLWTSKYLG